MCTKKNATCSGMIITVDISPLPYIANQIIDAHTRAASREGIDISRRMIRVQSFTATVDLGHLGLIPFITPRISAIFMTALSNVLPFPFVRKTFAGPFSIGSGIFNRDMSDRLVGTISRIATATPVLQKVGRISRLITTFIQELFELAFCHGIGVHVKGLDMHVLGAMVS